MNNEQIDGAIKGIKESDCLTEVAAMRGIAIAILEAMKEPEPITKEFIDTLKKGKEPEEKRPRGVGELMESPKESEKGEFKIPCKKCAYWEEKDKHSPIREVYEKYEGVSKYFPKEDMIGGLSIKQALFDMWNAIKKYCEEG